MPTRAGSGSASTAPGAAIRPPAPAKLRSCRRGLTCYPLDSVPNRNSFKIGQHFIPRQHYSVPSGFATWTSPYVGGWSGSIFLQGA
jgi:hypothetical protein